MELQLLDNDKNWPALNDNCLEIDIPDKPTILGEVDSMKNKLKCF